MPFIHLLPLLALSLRANAAPPDGTCPPNTLRILVKQIEVPVRKPLDDSPEARALRTEQALKTIFSELKAKQSGQTGSVGAVGIQAIEVIANKEWGELVLFSIGENGKAPTWYLYETTGGTLFHSHTPPLAQAQPHATLPLQARGEGASRLFEKAIKEIQRKDASPEDVRRFHDIDASQRVLVSNTGHPHELRELSLILPNGENVATVLLPDDIHDARFTKEGSVVLVSEGKTRPEGGWTDAKFKVFDATNLEDASESKAWKALHAPTWSRIEQVEAHPTSGKVYVVGQKTGDSGRNATRALYAFTPGQVNEPEVINGVAGTVLADIKRVDRIVSIPDSDDLLIFAKTNGSDTGSVLMRYNPTRQVIRWHRHLALENALDVGRDLQMSPDGKQIVVRELDAKRSGIVDVGFGNTLQPLPPLPPQKSYDFRWAAGGDRLLWIEGRGLRMWAWKPSVPAARRTPPK